MRIRVRRIEKEIQKLQQKILRKVISPGVPTDVGLWEGAESTKYRTPFNRFLPLFTFSHTRNLFKIILQTFAFAFGRSIIQREFPLLSFAFYRSSFLDVTYSKLSFFKDEITFSDEVTTSLS